MSRQLDNIAVRFNVGGRGRFQSIRLRRSTFSFKLLTLFKIQGLIQSYSLGPSFIEAQLKYFHGMPLIKHIEVISKPGKRIFWSLEQLSMFYGARAFSGFYVVSTPKGIFTSNECLTTLGMSGEILFKVTLN